MTRDPLVSMIVPTNDRPSSLAAALLSAAGQSVTDFECIVLEDARSQRATVPEVPRFRIARRPYRLVGRVHRELRLADRRSVQGRVS